MGRFTDCFWEDLQIILGDGCPLRADDCMLTTLVGSAVLRADAPTLEASMEMAGKLAASSCCLAGTVAMVGWSALDAKYRADG